MERLSILKRRMPSPMARFCTIHLKQIPMARWCKANVQDPDRTILVTGVRAQESRARSTRVTFSPDSLTGMMLWMPIHKWTHDQVFEIHRQYQIPPNPLYLNGMGRVGCWPCIMAKKEELAAIAIRYPETFDRLQKMEERAAAATGKPAMSFFSNDKTPARFHSETCQQSGKTFPTAKDVKRWALGEIPQTSNQLPILFEEDWTEDSACCLSQYGLCE
jgi:3'-phosphoadenosine 5'-phosphosulfate sulfotransferase (PAPS reductase)/FAD synthetase